MASTVNGQPIDTDSLSNIDASIGAVVTIVTLAENTGLWVVMARVLIPVEVYDTIRS